MRKMVGCDCWPALLLPAVSNRPPATNRSVGCPNCPQEIQLLLTKPRVAGSTAETDSSSVLLDRDAPTLRLVNEAEEPTARKLVRPVAVAVAAEAASNPEEETTCFKVLPLPEEPPWTDAGVAVAVAPGVVPVETGSLA